MSKARVNADNVTADIAGVTAGVGITGGGTSGTVTITNDMATTIAAAGDLIYGTANDAYAALSLGTAGKVLKVNSGATAPEWAVDPTTDVVTTAGDLIYGTGADAVDRLGIGTAGQVLKVNSGATAPEWGSSGTTWTQRTVLGNSVRTIAYNGTNLYVAAGTGGVLFTSSDGITWTSRTSGFGANYISKVSFGNGLWVAVGNNGTITTSTDGITWTARTSNVSTNELYDVLYANSIWVAVAAGGGTTNTGGITYSTDGITWTRKSQSLTIGATYLAVIYNGTNWIVGATNSTNNFLRASTPSGTWTVGSTGVAKDIYQLFYDGTRTLEINADGDLRYSTSATFGATTVISGMKFNTNTAQSLAYYYNGKIYGVGTYYVAASTTPLSGDYINQTNIAVLSPSTRNNVTGGNTNASYCIFVGDGGTIIGSESPGQIYTSF